MDPELEADREVVETLDVDIEVPGFEVVAAAPVLLKIELDVLGFDIDGLTVLDDAVEPVIVELEEMEQIEVALAIIVDTDPALEEVVLVDVEEPDIELPD